MVDSRLSIWRAVPGYVRASGIAILGLLGVGTVGYMTIEGWALHDALYMTLITLTTIGYREVQPLTLHGQWFTIGFIFVSIVIYVYAASSIGSYLLSEEFRQWLHLERIRRRVRDMHDHVIVCGFGRIGLQIAQELRRARADFVLIERDPDRVDEARAMGYAVVPGDATQEETLIEAGVERARSLIATTATDADNAFIALTARSLNPDLLIVARVSDPAFEPQLIRAGANRALSPYRIGALRMAEMVIRPHVYEFIEIATGRGPLELLMEEVEVQKGSELEGKTLAECDIRRRFGVLIVGLTQQTQTGVIFNPDPEQRLQAGTVMIALGKQDQIDRLREAAARR